MRSRAAEKNAPRFVSNTAIASPQRIAAESAADSTLPFAAASFALATSLCADTPSFSFRAFRVAAFSSLPMKLKYICSSFRREVASSKIASRFSIICADTSTTSPSGCVTSLSPRSAAVPIAPPPSIATARFALSLYAIAET